MIWVTWRQFRTTAWVFAVFLGALGVALAATGPGIVHAYHSDLAGCAGAACDEAKKAFLQDFQSAPTGVLFFAALGVMYLLPPVIGVFWGAPLVARELETGTFRLVWNQSVSRTRWLVVKLVGLGLVATATSGVAGLAFTWWSAPVFEASPDRLSPAAFGALAVVPFGYAAFAFVVGAAAGSLSRRTVLAMGITLVVVLGAMAAMPLAVRAHLTTPVHVVEPLTGDDILGFGIGSGAASIRIVTTVDIPGAVVLSSRTITASGAEFTGPGDPAHCAQKSGGNPEKCKAWLVATQGLRQDAWYIPASRFWALQWAELGLFLGMAVLLGVGCFWWVRRRVA